MSFSHKKIASLGALKERRELTKKLATVAEKLVACNFPLATALVLLLQSNPYNGFKSLLFFFSSFVMYSLVFICIEPPKHDFWAVVYRCGS